jgi:hypothetical protein
MSRKGRPVVQLRREEEAVGGKAQGGEELLKGSKEIRANVSRGPERGMDGRGMLTLYLWGFPLYHFFCSLFDPHLECSILILHLI